MPVFPTAENIGKEYETMAVSKDWLDRTGTKICVEDIYQIQLMYEEPDSSHGPLVGTRSLYLSEKGSLYQCVEYYDADKTNERYPASVEIALNADDMERLRSGDRKVENYKTCLSGLQKTTIWKYLSDPKQFKTVHEETNKVSDYSECVLRRPVATSAFASGHSALPVAGVNQPLFVQS